MSPGCGKTAGHQEAETRCFVSSRAAHPPWRSEACPPTSTAASSAYQLQLSARLLLDWGNADWMVLRSVCWGLGVSQARSLWAHVTPTCSRIHPAWYNTQSSIFFSDSFLGGNTMVWKLCPHSPLIVIINHYTAYMKENIQPQLITLFGSKSVTTWVTVEVLWSNMLNYGQILALITIIIS